MDDFDPFEQMSERDHSGEFMRPFVGGLIGGYIGHLLSKTRFGQWYEHNPVVGFIYFLILLGILGYLVYCGVAFIVILIHVFMTG